MSNYWKNKLEELNAENEKKTSSSTGDSSNYWKNRLNELEKQHTKTTDIAPLPSFQYGDGDERKWYQKIFQEGSAAGDDGWQFRDVVKGVAATGKDAAIDVFAGMAGIVEGVVDTGATILGLGASAVGAKDFEQQMSEFVAKELIDEQKLGEAFVNAPIINVGGQIANAMIGEESDNYEELSFFGDTADVTMQAVGDLIVAYISGGASKSTTVAKWLPRITQGVTAFGREAENAFNEGATSGEAMTSASISGGAAALLEGMTGFFGGSAIDDVVSKQIATKISGQLGKTAAKIGWGFVGEGGEEFLEEVFGNFGRWITYQDEKTIKEMFASEEAFDAYAESIFVGGLLGGAGGGAKSINNIATGKDAATGLTANEQKVFDKVYEDAVAKAEEGGKKLTSKEKSEIYDDVMKALERGEVSINTIEEALGGDTFKTYQNAVSNEESLKAEYDTLKKEYDELYQTKIGDKSDAQIDRQAELKQKMESIQSKLNDADNAHFKQQLRDQMRQSAIDTITKGKDTYLVESYNENARRVIAYEADTSKYSEKQQEIVKKAIESGILNNTRRAHELVDMIAKLHEDKGVDFDFLNNEKLKESSYAVDGKFVNGYYDKANQTIGVNIDSKRYLDAVVGHEITHVLEGTDVYNELQKAVFKYAESKGEYESRRKNLESLYAEEDIDSELTADLIGDYLFRDADFIKNLSVKNRNLFQKIYDEIKYLCKIATAGSKEARELERIKKEFADAYREGGKASTEDGGKSNVKLSLSEQKTPTYDELVAKKPTRIVKVTEGIESAQYSVMKEAALKKATDEGWFDNPHHNVDTDSLIFITEKSFSHAFSNLDSVSGEDTIRSMAHIPEIIKEAVLVNVANPKKTTNREKKVYTFFGAIEGKNGIEPVKLTVKEFDFTSMNALPKNIKSYFEKNGIIDSYNNLYDTHALEVIGIEGIKKESDASGKGNGNDPLAQSTSDSTISIADLLNLVKGDAEKYIPKSVKNSLSDSDGKQLSQDQVAYFKDSKMRDENGNLKVMYHGSQDAGFHVFDPSRSDDDTSLFFVDRNDVAASYSGTTETYEAKTIRTAEDMNNFLAEIGYDQYEAVEKDGKFELLENNEHVAWSDTAQGLYDEFCWYEGVGEGDANYKVYLNLTNPLEVDAEGRNWNNISREFSQEVADRYNSLTAEEKAALSNLAEWGEYSIFRDEMLEARATAEQGGSGVFDEAYTKNLASAYEKLGGANANLYDAFSIASENFSDEAIKEYAMKQMNTRDYAQKAKAEGYDGVIFKNIHDNGGYSNGSEGASTVAIAFNSNQIKSVANEKPTGDKDIRYSLAEQESTKLKEVGLEYDAKSETVSYSLSSLEDAFHAHTDGNGVLLNENDYTKARDEYVNALAKSIAVDKENPTAEEKMKASKYLDGLFLIHDMIAADKDRLDYEAAVDKSSWVSNSEYGGSIDFSTLCAKRRLFTGTFDAIQNALPDTVLNENDFLKIRDMLLEKELESPCSMCYVEGSRAKHGVYVDKWLKEYLATNPEWKPQIADFTSSTRLERTRIEHPEAYAEYQKAMNKLAQRKPKEASVRTDYKGEILVAFEDGSSVEIKNQNGGIRFNSFSDFEIIHALDCMQVITDMARVGLNGQAYTKVKEFAESFGNTGLKINLSLVAKDVDENGKLIMDETNGMKYSEAMDIRNKYSDNVGTVIVVFNDAQVRAALADSTIDYVLPFHRSQWKKSQYTMMGLPVVTKDYTALQNDRIRNPKTGKPVKLSKLKQATTYTNDITGETYVIKDNIMPNMYWDYSKSGRDNANRYLDYINANGMTPKFDFLLEKVDGKWVLPDGAVGDGYFKLLIDFKMYNNDGWGAPQNPVLPEFNMPYIQQMLENYKGGHQSFPVAHDVVDAFVEGKKNGVYSLSHEGEAPVNRYGRISGDDVRLVAPIQEDVAENATTTPTVSNLEQVEDYAPVTEEEANALQSENIASLTDADVPPEVEVPYYGESEDVEPSDPFENRDIKEVGNRKVKAYMYENPEVKPFFQAEADVMLGELLDTTKGERFYTPVEGGVPGEYGSDSYGVWSGTSRHTTDDIAYLLDTLGYSYSEIEKGLQAIIKDNGAENNACSKRIEFLLNDRLMNGYRDLSGYPIPADQDYINLLNEKQISEYNEEAKNKLFENADLYAPVEVTEESSEAPMGEAYEAIKPKQTKEPSMKRIENPIEDIAPTETYETQKAGQIDGQRTMFSEGKTAKVLTEEPKIDKKSRSAWSMVKNNVLDKGMVFEDLSLATGNRELQARWNSIRYSEGKAQKLIGEGNASVSSLNSVRETVEQSGKTEQFYEYLYHMHNVDRMSLEKNAAPTIGALRGKFGHLKIEQVKAIAAKKITDQTTEKTANTIQEAKMYLNALETKNKPVFGDSVTAEVSKETAAKLEKANPEFKEYAKEVYDYMNYLRDMLVDGGVISSDTAKLWAEMYPHYVPIRRQGDTGLNINVPLDTGRTGVNAPIKRATGGNRDILPLFDTMAMRTEQTYKAIAKNRFGVELKNTLGTTIADEATSVDDAIDSIEAQDGLLQEGKNGNNPTFTVFENGKKVTFEITEEMYDAMKPTGKGLSYTNKALNTVTNVFRGLLTEYNPVFMATNAVKDAQDVLINSQHATKTYAAIPKAIKQMATNGHWYQEYLANGGEQNTYFDGNTNTFKAEDNGIKKVIGMPLRGISFLNNTIERVPRLAEYIASREAGRSVDVSMLDAARVTTNFAAGGDVTKFFNRNGFNFLNASMQGAMQQARNVREAKANGLKGWVQLASKVALAGIPALILNNLLWDDDEEYEELSDYVKDNYYVVAKFGDGRFVRIPKGRTLAVIQDAFEQVSNALTGDDEVDLQNFLELAISNLAPNNPLENNILAPIMQVKSNKTWYGEDLVPTRLQDLPDAEQYDESTDAISKWLGEKLNYSPYKFNYLLNQYSGGVGDVVLPMLTPEAESGDNSLAGNILAPWKDKFTTDSTMNNQNVSDFYDTKDELTTNAKRRGATDEDVLKSKYINSIGSDLGELYKKKREIQNSNLDDADKYEAVRKIQEQINSLARESLNTYNDVYISDGYAVVGDRYYKLNDEGEWTKISDKQLEKQEEVTEGLGIDPSAYWGNKTEYDFAYEYPEKYAVAKSVGGFESYKTYSSELYDIKADKDEDGKSIVGSRKEKVIEYVNNLDVDYGIRLILFKNEYNADDTYNYEIIEYLNSRDDISYEDMETILKELGFTVSSDGTITWD